MTAAFHLRMPPALRLLLVVALLAGAGSCSQGGGEVAEKPPQTAVPEEGGQVVRIENPRLYIVPGGASGAVYMDIIHSGSSDDRLLRVEMEGVQSAQTHESIAGEDGVMRMRGSPNGFPLPADSVLKLERGGKHVMLLGFSQPLPHVGERVELTLHFEKADAMTVQVPVKEYGE